MTRAHGLKTCKEQHIATGAAVPEPFVSYVDVDVDVDVDAYACTMFSDVMFLHPLTPRECRCIPLSLTLAERSAGRGPKMPLPRSWVGKCKERLRREK